MFKQRHSFPANDALFNAHTNPYDILSEKNEMDEDMNNEKELQHRDNNKEEHAESWDK